MLLSFEYFHPFIAKLTQLNCEAFQKFHSTEPLKGVKKGLKMIIYWIAPGRGE